MNNLLSNSNIFAAETAVKSANIPGLTWVLSIALVGFVCYVGWNILKKAAKGQASSAKRDVIGLIFGLGIIIWFLGAKGYEDVGAIVSTILDWIVGIAGDNTKKISGS
tara:strand:- start:254 stop:577 length:324 start_codon:yes stop_codon:yes gene_type:complete